MRKLSKEKEKRRAQFIKDPYNFTRSLLGEAKSGSLNSPKEEVEAFLKETHSDPNSRLSLDENLEIDLAEHPTIHNREWICQHLNPKGWDPRICRLPGTLRSPKPDDT